MTDSAAKAEPPPTFQTPTASPVQPSAGPSVSQRISPTHLEAFDRMGFVRMPGFFDVERQLAPILYDLNRAGCHFSDQFDHRSAETIRTLSPESQAGFGRLVGYLPSVHRLAASDTMLDLSRAAGLRFPIVRRRHELVLDMPDSDSGPGAWRQDAACHIGSRNSLGFWIPLVEASAETGTIEVIAGSHRDGLWPFRYAGKSKPRADAAISPEEIEIEQQPAGDTITIDAKPGDLVVYSQLLVYRRLPNRSGRPQWTAQIRHADGFEQDFIDAGFPVGEETNIFHTTLYGKVNPPKR